MGSEGVISLPPSLNLLSCTLVSRTMEFWRTVAFVLMITVGVKTNSILEIINTEEVAKLLEHRRINGSKVEEAPVEEEDVTDVLQNLEEAKVSLRNLLKGSEHALVVTKKSHLKKDWCKTEPLLQRIHEPGCHSKTIVNRFCYGQCNSFYIPRGFADRRKRPGQEAAFRSCPVCRPKRASWITVTLACPSLQPPSKRKKVYRVKHCKCVPYN